MDTIECKQCGGDMKRGNKVDSSIVLQLVGVIIFLIGLGLLIYIVWFPISTGMGLILMVAAGRMGYKKQSGWKCKQCGYFFEAEKPSIFG